MTPLRAAGIGGALIAILIAGWIALVAPHRNAERTAAPRGTPVEPPKTATDFVLTGSGGRPLHLIDRRFAVTFLFFGYTRCPDECPLAMASLGRAFRSLPRDVASRTRVVFVTVDPRHDTPLVISRYVGAFERRFVGLTGSPALLAEVRRAYGVTVDARSGEIGHGDEIDTIDRDARIVLVYPPNVAASDLAFDATALAAASVP